MWLTRLIVVDWVHSKTQILLETFEDSKTTLGRIFVHSEDEHLSTSVGCATNKRQYPTVLQNRKSFRWIVVFEWMDYLLSIYEMW